MNIPTATYRLQFSPDFTFEHARPIIGYLKKLGITHVYASPVFRARRGSTHGYDITDPRVINPELGGREAFDALQADCSAAEIGWVQDIVPNHMALNSDNPFLVDLLENGTLSRYHTFFDIDWDHPYEALRGKVQIPVLGKSFGRCLEAGELRLQFDAAGLAVVYFDHRFPLRIDSYASVFGLCAEALRGELGDEHPDFLKFLGVLYTVKGLPGADDIQERYHQIGFIKMLLWEMYTKSEQIRSQCDSILALFNGGGDGSDPWVLLETVLEEQHFRLRYWKTATEELNYRRFFTVNDLIAVRVEDGDVFSVTHELIAELVGAKRLQGLRIDHIDGLYDPAEYCERLRRLAPEAYIVVEKILCHNEDLFPAWPVQGTTGYDFLNAVNRLFCSGGGRRAMDRLYVSFVGDRRSYDELVAEKKRLIIGRHMAGDIDNLAMKLKTVAGRDRRGVDITMYGLRRALVELLTFFPVYRTYATENELHQSDRIVLKGALDASRAAQPAFSAEFDYIEAILALDTSDQADQAVVERRRFIMRLQQFTGPLLAKGIEDTALYSYNRLVSLNEVGGHPDLFDISVEDFHAFCAHRAAHWPHTMNATATHDTKRGEETRARINVLSEIAAEWSHEVRQWRELTESARGSDARGQPMPSANDEYLFYQTILGTYPVTEEFDREAYATRIREYLLKAVREAKVHSDWIRPSAAYEEALTRFADATLANESFLAAFVPFVRKVAWYGVLNALSQMTIKITAPGLPDFYQGTELWDFSLVDPDNRRQVDFGRREGMLDALIAREGDPALPAELAATPLDGRIKLYLIRQLLSVRRRHPTVFPAGRYLPLTVKGPARESVVAFMRSSSEEAVIVIAPRLMTRVTAEGRLPLGRDLWGETSVVIPPEYDDRIWHAGICGGQVIPEGGRLFVGDLLSEFPVAVCEA